MKLIDKLRQIERDNALFGGTFAKTLERLSALMCERARKKEGGFILVGVRSAQVEDMIRSWALGEGLEVLGGSDGFTRELWLVWGRGSMLAGRCDAEVMPDGVLVMRGEKNGIRSTA